jgi:predicted  nucleic acid-binding Zn-ribbon protein
VRCGNVYQDNDSSILKGCSCGSTFFLYMRTPQDAVKIEKIEEELKTKKTSLEKEIKRKIKIKKAEMKKIKEKIKPKRFRVIEFGIETVRIPREGVYEIDIDALMKKQPLIILEKGRVYFIHLPSVFEKFK